MLNGLERAFNELARLGGRMDSTQWIVVMAVAVVLGYFILSGYKSQLG